jgi:hypothetical protein
MRLRRPRHAPNDPRQLRTCLIAIEDVLRQVSPDALRQRGSWNQALFVAVLERVEALTPPFQAALTDYVCHHNGARPRDTVTALLDVDRLSAAYLYWTRLFPPRQPDESMFVLSLLHDLGDRVHAAIHLLDSA